METKQQPQDSSELEYTTIRDYRQTEPECTGDFVAPGTGDVLPEHAKITVNRHTGQWCAGHYDGNATWEPLRW